MAKNKKPVILEDTVDKAKSLNLKSILEDIKARKSKLPYYGEFIGE